MSCTASSLYAILISVLLRHLPCPQRKATHCQSCTVPFLVSFLFPLSAVLPVVLSFLWHEGSQSSMFPKSRRHLFKLSSGPLSSHWLKVRGKHPPTAVMGWISWKLTLGQNFVCRMILQGSLRDQRLWKGSDGSKCAATEAEPRWGLVTASAKSTGVLELHEPSSCPQTARPSSTHISQSLDVGPRKGVTLDESVLCS